MPQASTTPRPAAAPRTWVDLLPAYFDELVQETKDVVFEHRVEQQFSSEPPTCGKAVQRFLLTVVRVLPEWQRGVIAERNGKSRWPGLPGEESRKRMKWMVGERAQALLTAASLLADGQEQREEIRHQLRPLLLQAAKLRGLLDGAAVVKASTLPTDGPWLGVAQELDEMAEQARSAVAYIPIEPPIAARESALEEAGEITPLRNSRGDGAATEDAVGSSSTSESLPGAFLAESDLAMKFGVNQAALRRQLPEWRRLHNNNDWMPTQNPRPRDPQYLYRVRSIMPLIHQLLAAAKAAAKRRRK